eukprot:6207378-Prymnesium_polylepis.2
MCHWRRCVGGRARVEGGAPVRHVVSEYLSGLHAKYAARPPKMWRAAAAAWSVVHMRRVQRWRDGGGGRLELQAGGEDGRRALSDGRTDEDAPAIYGHRRGEGWRENRRTCR